MSDLLETLTFGRAIPLGGEESKSEKLREKTSFQILLGPLMHLF